MGCVWCEEGQYWECDGEGGVCSWPMDPEVEEPWGPGWMIYRTCKLKNTAGQNADVRLIALPDRDDFKKRMTVILDCPGGETIRVEGKHGGGKKPKDGRSWLINAKTELKDKHGKTVPVRVQAYEYEHPDAKDPDRRRANHPEGWGPKVRLDQTEFFKK